MKLETQMQGNVAVLRPRGPLLREGIEDFQRSVDETGARCGGRLVLDLSDVPFLDSVGIETLLALNDAAAPAMRPRLALLGDTVREALQLTDVLDKLTVFDTVENAIRSYKR